MKTDHHQSFLQMIDEKLAGGLSAEREQSLRDHLSTCTACQEYLSASNKVIKSLGEFSFTLDPSLNARVLVSLQQTSRLAPAAKPERRPWVLISVAAFLLTFAGSLIDLQCGRLIASFFALQRMQVRQELLALWIVPSFYIVLLFPLLPLLLKAGTSRGERTL